MENTITRLTRIREEAEKRKERRNELKAQGYRAMTILIPPEVKGYWEVVAQRRGQEVEQLLIEAVDRLSGLKPHEELVALSRAQYAELRQDLYRSLKDDFSIEVLLRVLAVLPDSETEEEE